MFILSFISTILTALCVILCVAFEFNRIYVTLFSVFDFDGFLVLFSFSLYVKHFGRVVLKGAE